MPLLNRVGLLQVRGYDFSCDNLVDCDVFILDFSSQVQIDDCKNCRFFIGPVDGSFFVRNSTNCTFTVACRQFRAR